MDLNEIITGLNAKITEGQKSIDESKKSIMEAKNQIRKLRTLSKKANEVLYSKCVSLGDGQPNGIEIDHGILDELKG